MSRYLNRKIFLTGLAGFIIGILIILGIRFFTYRPVSDVHYHANFAMYLNGQREQFKDIFYYIDVGNACTVEEQKMTPYERTHLHDNVNDVVHVEDDVVTWGQFFQNIGWIVDPGVIKTPDKVLLPDTDNKITFILNGETIGNIVSMVIKDQDRLLIDYGTTSAQDLQEEYKTVPATAHKYDVTLDPKSCSGHKKTTLHDRLVHMF